MNKQRQKACKQMLRDINDIAEQAYKWVENQPSPSEKKKYSSNIEWKLISNDMVRKVWYGYSRKTKKHLFEIVYDAIFSETPGYDLFFKTNNKCAWYKTYSSLRTAKKGAEAAIKEKIKEGKFWEGQI